MESNVKYERTFVDNWKILFLCLKHVMHYVLYIIKGSLAAFESLEPVNKIMLAIRAAYI